MVSRYITLFIFYFYDWNIYFHDWKVYIGLFYCQEYNIKTL